MTGDTSTGTTFVELPKIIKTDYAIPADYVGIFVIWFFLGFYLCYSVASVAHKNYKLQ